MSSASVWTPVATLDDLWEGEVAEFEVGDRPILLAHLRSGEIRAYDGLCPHAGFPLVDGEVENDVLTCSAHSWEFDLATGAGVNPANCRLHSHPVRLDGDQITVSLTEGDRR
ncbi:MULTISPECIES: Rieske 2Fe-2S domain-containing protein [Mycobacterium]|jgi:toluene monooxygenase system ferredoxin subunit|uniref:(2Fe-2S)-binding protein n=1 Tax=Mycobacterium gordonae TaxID=1778 RepID=A0A1A6B897_MYCGO|nr:MULTISPECIES: Rieske 2Fe-2S domain-containing protein [Mycobacterium]MBI2701697.1 Rieske 2Fe-2S domain-containing protein [Mycobacterium sp.]MBX9979273.1 Rieske 2Fe-2S domain-containing protein [Mycobacterium gordonae]MCQ4361256.1 Rieske 2Fe-2S domain-containing protein [Mycobacterium gordonae]MCV7004261.1 Rieske 2Fe-2S domain-containing protein [Mycobacterium gordonae]OBR98559.1 (2Fe-2S)-binding protein [Mycobacterium gordonae]